MKNAQQAIENFFNEKIQEEISKGYEEILKPIKDKKQNHDHREVLEKWTAEEDAIESNQWTRKKLEQWMVVCGSDRELSQLIEESLNLYQEASDSNQLKEKLSEKIKSLKKKINQSQLSEQNKNFSEKIDKEKLQPDKHNKNRRLLKKLSEIDTEIANAMKSAEKAAQEKFQRNKWINDAAQKATEISIGMTHIAKLTHSSTRASNIDSTVLGENSSKTLLVTVNCAKEIKKDFSYSTAAYSPIAEFLHSTGKEICTNSTLLKPYAEDDKQLKKWQEQFNYAFNEKNKSSHVLAKQVYFPVETTNYHLLTPLVSSSLAQLIYERIWKTRQKDMPGREARNNSVFSQETDTLFNKTAILKVTQSQHQNVSNLNGSGNGKRTGQLILLPAISPQWQTQTKLPIHLKTVFNKQLAAQAREPLTELKNLLLAINAHRLSVNFQRKQIIRELIAAIADIVFDHAVQIQGLKQFAGWSQESKLPTHQQYWLDPLRTDEEFQNAKLTLDWSPDVVIDFSKWINRNIKHKQLTLGAAHEKQWQKLFAPLLREFNALSEADLAINTEKVEA
ncbi:type I-F CRISPR-associated protein Csy1 [Nitrosomonas communis]|uniref:CRISPR-associated protein Csy1 n=1 Tax=Nitrosomonas communis TaxID=44574 RepID=A0A1I4NR94_9PROT|nr:type I-F CRISPR-associated protein Csy1 [Nitrosomonas communis]SFM17946.1 CRISPR-associated protein Csy1 [Nitrosomonas communis]